MTKDIGVASIAAICTVLVWLLMRHYIPENARPPAMLVSTSTRGGSSAISVPVTSTDASTSPASVPQGWRSLLDNQYKFQVDYPANGWSFFNGDNIADPSIPLGTPRYIANLFTTRLAGPASRQDQESITIVIAAYDSTPHVSLDEDLSRAIGNLHSLPPGSIDDALAKAYDGEGGVVTYKETTTADGTAISEVGAVVDGGGRLSYTTFLEKPGGNFIYAVELQLQFDKQENDSQYLQIYKQMLSTLRVID